VLERHAYTERVLDGTLEDDATFGFISAAEEDDDWQKPATWARGNPNLGCPWRVTTSSGRSVERQNPG